MKFSFSHFAFLGFGLLFWNCSSGSQENSDLPYLGNKHTENVPEIDPVSLDTLLKVDTVYHKIAPFSFFNQNGKAITNKEVEGRVYVADFFFTSCPTICPVMKKQMLRVYEKFKHDPDFRILSHSIDPTYDTVALLKDYSLRLGVEDDAPGIFLRATKRKFLKSVRQVI